MRVRTGLAGLACLALLGCDGLGKTSATLTPLPTTKPVFVPSTTTTIVPTPAPAAPATNTIAPTTTVAAETTTTEAATTTSSAPVTTVLTTAATSTTTSARSAASTTSTTSTTIAAATLLKTWILQLGSAPTGAPNQAIAAQLAQLREIAPEASTLRSGDWPQAFTGPDRVIFFIPGFDSKEAVKRECARLGLRYPDHCIGRFMKR